MSWWDQTWRWKRLTGFFSPVLLPTTRDCDGDFFTFDILMWIIAILCIYCHSGSLKSVSGFATPVIREVPPLLSLLAAIERAIPYLEKKLKKKNKMKTQGMCSPGKTGGGKADFVPFAAVLLLCLTYFWLVGFVYRHLSTNSGIFVFAPGSF